MPIKPTILKRQVPTASRLFHVEELHLRFSNGAERTYERLCTKGSGAVLIVPMLDDDTVILVREYGVGVEDYQLGLPKGHVERGENLLDAANRELKEEVGYGAKQLIFLKEMTQSPSYMQHKTHIVLARELYPETLPGDEPEELETEQFKLSELSELIAREDFTEARSIAALYLTQTHLGAVPAGAIK